jgi:protein subunit release factor A
VEDASTPSPFIPPESDAALLAQCDVTTFRATGPGGQGVNTTDSAVRMKHRPTGVTVVCRRERSQHQNREECLRRLRAKLVALAETPAERVATRTPRSARRRRLETKARTAGVKRQRRRPSADEE